MTTLQEAAMRKALEALETCSYGDYSAKHVVDPSFDGDAVEAAIESLNAALAQQGQEPEIEMIDAAMVEMANIHPPLERSECQRLIRAALTAAPAPHPTQPLLAHEVLKLNALWNKSSVKDSAIADQLAVCRVLAESEDDMELTDAQILTLWEETYVQRGWTGIEFARAIERAHGIGVKQ